VVDPDALFFCALVLRGHRGGVRCCAFARPDGEILIYCSFRNDRMTEYSTNVMYINKFIYYFYSAETPRLVATGGDDATVRLWRMPDGAPIRTLRMHTAAVRCLAFNSAATLLASGGSDAAVHLWNIEKPPPKRELYIVVYVECVTKYSTNLMHLFNEYNFNLQRPPPRRHRCAKQSKACGRSSHFWHLRARQCVSARSSARRAAVWTGATPSPFSRAPSLTTIESSQPRHKIAQFASGAAMVI
jgi:hypothetical protein